LYSSLAISPVSAWVAARAAVVNGHTMGAQIVHSEGNGVYDKMLLEMLLPAGRKQEDGHAQGTETRLEGGNRAGLVQVQNLCMRQHRDL